MDKEEVVKILEKDVFTVEDIMKVGFNLEPLKCLHCGEIGHLCILKTPQILNWSCESCGEWQLKDNFGD